MPATVYQNPRSPVQFIPMPHPIVITPTRPATRNSKIRALLDACAERSRVMEQLGDACPSHVLLLQRADIARLLDLIEGRAQ